MEICQGCQGHILGNVCVASSLHGDIQAGSHFFQFYRIFDGIILGQSLGVFQKGVGQVLGMTGMGCSARCNGPVQAPCHHDIG